MRNSKDPTVGVPGDGYCGLHACLAHTLLATQFMNSPQCHVNFMAMRDALQACKDDIVALPDNAVEYFRLGSSSLPTRMHDIFSEFPAWHGLLIFLRARVLSHICHEVCLRILCSVSCVLVFHYMMY